MGPSFPNLPDLTSKGDIGAFGLGYAVGFFLDAFLLDTFLLAVDVESVTVALVFAIGCLGVKNAVQALTGERNSDQVDSEDHADSTEPPSLQGRVENFLKLVRREEIQDSYFSQVILNDLTETIEVAPQLYLDEEAAKDEIEAKKALEEALKDPGKLRVRVEASPPDSSGSFDSSGAYNDLVVNWLLWRKNIIFDTELETSLRAAEELYRRCEITIHLTGAPGLTRPITYTAKRGSIA